MLALSSHSSTPASDNSGPVPRGPFARRPSYVDLGDEDEDFWDEQDEQYRQREDYDSDPRFLEMRRSQLQPSRPMGPPQTDLRSRLTNRTAASPPRYDAPALRAQWTGPTRPGPVRGASVRAAVSKFQYGTDASGSTPSLELQHSGTSGTTPVPIPKSGSHQESAEGNSLGLALSAPPAAGSLRDPESLRSHNPNLRVVNGELRMTVFPERKGSSGYATGQQLALARSDSIVASPPVHAGDDPIKQRIDQLERERAQSRAMVAKHQSPGPARPSRSPPPLPITATTAPTSLAPVTVSTQSFSASPNPRESVEGTFALDPASALQHSDSLLHITPHHVSNIVSELRAAALRKSPPASPRAASPPPDAGTKKPSKWAPVDTSVGLKRKWEPGNRIPSTLSSYVHLLGGGSIQNPLTKVM